MNSTDLNVIIKFQNVGIESSVRGVAAELLLQQNPDPKILNEIFSVLKSEKKGFVSFVLSRVVEFSETDANLAKLVR